ncbi:MAG: hypothetical protein LUG60_05330 [Erysipelotrichaceae bacterium]|nr:hypothetical protein [Erysipelotrichaceae bacterium]
MNNSVIEKLYFLWSEECGQTQEANEVLARINDFFEEHGIDSGLFDLILAYGVALQKQGYVEGFKEAFNLFNEASMK